jgi:hypothetical protein
MHDQHNTEEIPAGRRNYDPHIPCQYADVIVEMRSDVKHLVHGFEEFKKAHEKISAAVFGNGKIGLVERQAKSELMLKAACFVSGAAVVAWISEVVRGLVK